jgi:hypothetical protein
MPGCRRFGWRPMGNEWVSIGGIYGPTPDGVAKFSINNFEPATLVGSSPPRVLTVFQAAFNI